MKPTAARPTRLWPTHLWIVILALAAALLACTLSMDDAGDAPDNAESAPTRAAAANTEGAPTVRIVAPENGAVVPVDQPVDIEVETDRTATSFLLSEGGQVRSIINMPEGQTGPTKAILRWTPTRADTFNLEVIATNQRSTSAPAAVTIQASGTAAAGGGTSCTGRVMVTELNYRDGPTTRANKLGQFDIGETVSILARNADTSWYRVQRFNEEQVWVINNAQWLRTDGPCETLPVAQ